MRSRLNCTGKDGCDGNTEQCIEQLEKLEATGSNLHSVTVTEDDPDAQGKIYEQLVGR